LPFLQDLIDELNKDINIGGLDELTQSLLADIASNLDAVDQDVKPQNTIGESDSSGEMVGSTQEQLEPSGNGSSVNGESTPSDLAEFLLLHHDYSCKPPAPTRITRNKNKLKPIRPKNNVQTPKVVVERIPEVPEAATLCGYYDEGENCITIIVDDDQDINETVAQLQEQIKETNTISNDNLLNPLLDCNYSSAASDGGYESLGSPNSFHDDLFDSTVSELFPQLI